MVIIKICRGVLFRVERIFSRNGGIEGEAPAVWRPGTGKEAFGLGTCSVIFSR